MSAYRALASVYDRLTVNVEYKKRAEYIISLLRDFGKGKGILLDAACGTGNMSELFARSGFEVIGVDNSPDMLFEAQNKKYQSGLDILYLHQDIRSLDLYGTVDAAVCCLDSINHLPNKKDVQNAFSSIGLFMEKDGIFVFDVNSLYKHRHILGNHTFVYDLEDVFCVWQNSFHEEKLRTDIHMDLFIKNGKDYMRGVEEFSEYCYREDELIEALHKSNFEVLARFGELKREPPKEKEERIYYVCKKTKNQ